MGRYRWQRSIYGHQHVDQRLARRAGRRCVCLPRVAAAEPQSTASRPVKRRCNGTSNKRTSRVLDKPFILIIPSRGHVPGSGAPVFASGATGFVFMFRGLTDSFFFAPGQCDGDTQSHLAWYSVLTTEISVVISLVTEHPRMRCEHVLRLFDEPSSFWPAAPPQTTDTNTQTVLPNTRQQSHTQSEQTPTTRTTTTKSFQSRDTPRRTSDGCGQL